MKYNVNIITIPEYEMIECTDFYAETDAEAMEYAMNQLCFNTQQIYIMNVYCYDSDFSAMANNLDFSKFDL